MKQNKYRNPVKRAMDKLYKPKTEGKKRERRVKREQQIMDEMNRDYEDYYDKLFC